MVGGVAVALQSVQPQYREIFSHAAEKKIPVFLTDAQPSPEAVNLLMKGIPTAEQSLIWGALGYSLLKDKNISRREFLKKLGIGVAGVAWASSNLPRILFPTRDVGDKRDMHGKLVRGLDTIHDTLHPEQEAVVVNLRNYINGQKMVSVARHLKENLARNPNISAVFGGAHFGLEEVLRKDDSEREQKIEELMHLPFTGEIRKQIAKIQRFDFDEKERNWKVTEVFDDSALAPLKNS